jgi:hypothetical protein
VVRMGLYSLKTGRRLPLEGEHEQLAYKVHHRTAATIGGRLPHLQGRLACGRGRRQRGGRVAVDEAGRAPVVPEPPPGLPVLPGLRFPRRRVPAPSSRDDLHRGSDDRHVRGDVIRADPAPIPTRQHSAATTWWTWKICIRRWCCPDARGEERDPRELAFGLHASIEPRSTGQVAAAAADCDQRPNEPSTDEVGSQCHGPSYEASRACWSQPAWCVLRGEARASPVVDRPVVSVKSLGRRRPRVLALREAREPVCDAALIVEVRPR